MVPVQDIISKLSLPDEMLTEFIRSVRQWMSEITVSDETKIALVAIDVLFVFGYSFVLPRLRRRRHSRPAIAVKA